MIFFAGILRVKLWRLYGKLWQVMANVKKYGKIKMYRFKQTSTKPKYGSKKTEIDGIKFDSRLEGFMYEKLQDAGIRFELQKKYELQSKFKYNSESIRAITYTVDFYLPDYDICIDTKGIATQQGLMRIKMLKRYFFDHGLNTKILLPKNQKECIALVGELQTTN